MKHSDQPKSPSDPSTVSCMKRPQKPQLWEYPISTKGWRDAEEGSILYFQFVQHCQKIDFCFMKLVRFSLSQHLSQFIMISFFFVFYLFIVCLPLEHKLNEEQGFSLFCSPLYPQYLAYNSWCLPGIFHLEGGNTSRNTVRSWNIVPKGELDHWALRVGRKRTENDYSGWDHFCSRSVKERA